MDQNNQQQNQPVQAPSDLQSTTNINPVSQQPQTQVPVQPTGGPKEFAPRVAQTQEEILLPTEQEVKLTPELENAGVVASSNPEEIKLNPDVKEAGVEVVKTAAPVPTSPAGTVNLPMTEDEAKKIIKSHPAVDAARWMATQVIEQFKKVHKLLK